MAHHSDHEFTKCDGKYTAVLHRGRDFFRVSDRVQRVESPLVDPLRKIGLDNRAIQRSFSKFPNRMLSEWTDITLAAMERFGKPFFRKSPAAYLIDNLNQAMKGTRLPPDWWLDIRKAEDRARAKLARDKRAGDKPDRNSLPEKAIASFDDIHDSIFDHFLSSGQNEQLAKVNSRQFKAALRKRKSS